MLVFSPSNPLARRRVRQVGVKFSGKVMLQDEDPVFDYRRHKEARQAERNAKYEASRSRWAGYVEAM